MEYNEREIRGKLTPTPELMISCDVNRFARSMTEKLMAKRDNGYWDGIPLSFYVRRLLEEVGELLEAVTEGDRESAAKECIDVGNFAMMLFINLERSHGPSTPES